MIKQYAILKDRFFSHWNRLELREKKSVAIGSILLVGFIFYAGLWSPYIKHITALRMHIAAEQKTLAKMQQADAAIKQLQSQLSMQSNRHASIMETLGLVQTQIARNGLASQLISLKQITSNSISVVFREVDFDKLMHTLIVINAQQPLHINAFSATTTPTPGLADVSITINIA